MDYENTKTPSMHSELGSATLSQLAFPRESNPNFPREKSHWDDTVVKGEKFIANINNVFVSQDLHLLNSSTRGALHQQHHDLHFVSLPLSAKAHFCDSQVQCGSTMKVT